MEYSEKEKKKKEENQCLCTVCASSNIQVIIIT